MSSFAERERKWLDIQVELMAIDLEKRINDAKYVENMCGKKKSLSDNVMLEKKDSICLDDDCIVKKSGIGFVGKSKEYLVVRFITSKFSQYGWKINKKVKTNTYGDDRTNFSRPDIHVELDDRIISIEVDENQHKSYDGPKEDSRIYYFCESMYHKNIHIIRFNPDKYVSKGKQIRSCWKLDDSGRYEISDKEQWDNRLAKLCDVINECITTDTQEPINLVYLFYDSGTDAMPLNEQQIKSDQAISNIVDENDSTKIQTLIENNKYRLKDFTRLTVTNGNEILVGDKIVYINLEKVKMLNGIVGSIEFNRMHYVFGMRVGFVTRWKISSDKCIIFFKHKKRRKKTDEAALAGRKAECNEWKSKLSAEELIKFEEMKALRETKKTKEEKKTLTDEYYRWLYARRPDLKKK